MPATPERPPLIAEPTTLAEHLLLFVAGYLVVQTLGAAVLHALIADAPLPFATESGAVRFAMAVVVIALVAATLFWRSRAVVHERSAAALRSVSRMCALVALINLRLLPSLGVAPWILTTLLSALVTGLLFAPLELWSLRRERRTPYGNGEERLARSRGGAERGTTSNPQTPGPASR